MMKFSAFYLEKQKSLIPKKKLSRCRYQNKKVLLTDPIFSEGFAFMLSHLKPRMHENKVVA